MAFKFIVFLFIILLPLNSVYASNFDKAEELLGKYVELFNALDSAVVDLYSDNAVITQVRTGRFANTVHVPINRYKEIFRHALTAARSNSKYPNSTFLDTSYKQEGVNIRINTKRFGVKTQGAERQFSDSLSLLVGPDISGQWRILEELSEFPTE